ncbi:MAG: DUF2206 domain-containing protein [Dehalococcoidia bacterium]
MMADPLQINDWEIKKFLLVISIVQFIVLGLLGLSALGIDIPVLRQTVGLIYLTFIPGIIIIRIFKLHNLGSVKTLVYCVGLSLAFDMFLGFLINGFYPYIGISRPISTFPLVITWTVVLGILSLIAYIRDKGYAESIRIDCRTLLSPPALLLFLLLSVSILGDCLLNAHQTGAIPVQLLVLGLGAVVVALIVFGKFIPHELYPLIIFLLALALLLHYSLSSFDVTGRDARHEYYLYSLVAANGVWNSAAVTDPYNAMLSVTILPAIFSNILNLDGRWLFIIIWPIFYALVPLGLYTVYERQVGNKNAFLAAFYLITISVFYATMTILPRQEIGMFFLALIILIIVDKQVSQLNRRILLITFAFALIVSHYTVSYVFLILCLIALSLWLVFNKPRGALMTTTFVLLFIVSALGWYIYNAQSSTFSAIAHIGQHLTASLYNELFNLNTREASFILTAGQPGALRYIHIGLLLLMQFFIGIGILKLIIARPRKKVYGEYDIFALACFSFLLVCIVVPFLTDYSSVERLYTIALLFLAPFCISGGELFLGLTWKKLNLGWKRLGFRFQRVSRLTTSDATAPPTGVSTDSLPHQLNQTQTWQGILALLLIALFFFASEFVYAIAEPGTSFITHPLDAGSDYLYSWFSPPEASGALWLLDRMDSKTQVWFDDSGRSLFAAYRGYEFGHYITVQDKSLKGKYPIPDGAYIFLRKYNINHGVIIAIIPNDLSWKRQQTVVNIDDIVSLDNRNRIYYNGGAVIYKDAQGNIK